MSIELGFLWLWVLFADTFEVFSGVSTLEQSFYGVCMGGAYGIFAYAVVDDLVIPTFPLRCMML